MELVNQMYSIEANILAEIEDIEHSEAQKLLDNEDWAVMPEDEAYEKAEEYIKENLWTFNHSFLCQYSDVIAKIPVKTWVRMANEVCEDFNDVVSALVVDELEYLVANAITTDGFGHFLDTYDGDHQEYQDYDGDDWIIVRYY